MCDSPSHGEVAQHPETWGRVVEYGVEDRIFFGVLRPCGCKAYSSVSKLVEPSEDDMRTIWSNFGFDKCRTQRCGPGSLQTAATHAGDFIGCMWGPDLGGPSMFVSNAPLVARGCPGLTTIVGFEWIDGQLVVIPDDLNGLRERVELRRRRG